MKVLARTRLRIRDQGELLNQIAGTYKDFFRAAMEYIDNVVDAAAALERGREKIQPEIHIQLDTNGKRLRFVDNCGGMSAQELSELLSEVGRSKKKAVAWANGQFGFGVHAFRAFAKEATFISRQKSGPEAKIKIDRSYGDERDVNVEATDSQTLAAPGTSVEIGRFDPQVFKRASFFRSLVSEIQHHFDDVLRSGSVRIFVRQDRSRPYECRAFDYAALNGTPVKKIVRLQTAGRTSSVEVDLKVLDRAQDNRLPVLTNKSRRIQVIAELKSFRNYQRAQGAISHVWANPFVVGSIEINDLCSPNLTRDDLRDSPQRDLLFETLVKIQVELQAVVDEMLNRKTKESYKKLADAMSDALSRILRGFRLRFDQTAPGGVNSLVQMQIGNDSGDIPFEGDDPGGGGPGPNSGGDGDQPGVGHGGPGGGSRGAGAGPGRRSDRDGESPHQITPRGGPRIEFQAHGREDRVIDLGGSLIVNTQHPDFIARNVSKGGRIRLDARLLNYVSLVVSPPCVHRLFERTGRVPTALEVGANVVDLSTKLEHELSAALLGAELAGDTA